MYYQMCPSECYFTLMMMKFNLKKKINYQTLTAKEKQTMKWMVSHDVKYFVAGQPLANGSLFTGYYQTVRVPRHERVHHFIQQW
jgi:hypothetical protein